MSKNQGRGARALLAVVAILVLCPPAMAVPASKTVRFAIHADPTDPQTEVVFMVILELEPAEVDGDSVGWEIVSATFVQGLRTGGEDPKWTIDEPSVNTTDGLWWIDHADADAPTITEFSEPPSMDGIAATTSQTDVNLSYSMEGSSYTPPPGGAPFASTAALTHSFRRVNEDEPEEEADDKPTELEEVDPV